MLAEAMCPGQGEELFGEYHKYETHLSSNSV